MSPPPDIQVLRIPAHGPFTVIECPSVTYENINDHAFSHETWCLEDHLGHVPNLKEFKRRISLKHRCLFDTGHTVNYVRKEWEGDYYIYKCIDEEVAELPRNGYFKHAHAYGDAFVFKLNQYGGFDKENKAIYGNMEDFARSVEARGKAYFMLKEMMNW